MKTQIKVISHNGEMLFQIGEIKFDLLSAYDVSNQVNLSKEVMTLTVMRNEKVLLSSRILIGGKGDDVAFCDIEKEKLNLSHLNDERELIPLRELSPNIFNINDELILEIPDEDACDIAKDLKLRFLHVKAKTEIEKNSGHSSESIKRLSHNEREALFKEEKILKEARVQELLDSFNPEEILRVKTWNNKKSSKIFELFLIEFLRYLHIFLLQKNSLKF